MAHIHNGNGPFDELQGPKDIDSAIKAAHVPTVRIFWNGQVRLADTAMAKVPSSLKMDPAIREALNETWAETLHKHQEESAARVARGEQPLHPLTNDKKFRYEGASQDPNGNLTLLVSEGIDYMAHNTLRHNPFNPDGSYADNPAGRLFEKIGRTTPLASEELIMPATMYAVTKVHCGDETYIVAGCWNQDQADKWATVPCGFYEPKELHIGEGTQTYAENIVHKFASQLQFSPNETTNSNLISAIAGNTVVHGVITGENRDVTTVMIGSVVIDDLSQLGLRGTKYKGARENLGLIPCTNAVLREIIDTGMYQGRAINDLFRQSLEFALHS